MTNIFERVHQNLNVLALPIALIAFIGLFAFGKLQLEDISSTGGGITLIGQAYNLYLYSDIWALRALSVVPDIAQNILLYMWMANTKDRRPLYGALMAIVIDLGFDMYRRTNGEPFAGISLDPTTLSMAGLPRFLTALAFCFFAYTVVSNVMLTVSFGLLGELADDAMTQVEEIWIPAFTRAVNGIASIVGGVIGALWGGVRRILEVAFGEDEPRQRRSSRR